MGLMKNQIPPILLEDNHLLAFAKPAGVATAPPAMVGELTLADLAQLYLKTSYRKPGNVYLGVVHRLDRPTSGVVLFTRTSKAAARL
jgi:23S rRNA pseudouridine1911/1915/1917 synthase